MKNKSVVLSLILVLLASFTWAAAPKTYQVTGPILEMKDGVIIVQKGDDKWEIALDSACKITGDLKVGSKVTIEYRMTAVTATVKDEAAKPAAKPDAGKKSIGKPKK
jgi:hypothetical protein